MKLNCVGISCNLLPLYFFFVFLSFNLNVQDSYYGSVVDENGEPLIGATVFVKNSTIGTQTDFDGNFILEANINDVLTIRYIGFKNQEFILTDQKDLGKIVLKEDVDMLDEIIVIGYGNQKKEILTSSVSEVKGDDLAIEPVVNVTQALQGKVAGLQIIASDAPGVASQVIIRGLGTL